MPSFPYGDGRESIVACVIRRTSLTAWEIIDGNGHAPMGVSSIEILSSPWRLRLHYDFTATNVRSVAVTPDEAFASPTNHFRVGASVGLTYMDIYTYNDTYGSTPVDPGLWSNVGANLWVFGLFEVAA